MNESKGEIEDEYVNRIRLARDSIAVLKYRLTILRAQYPQTPVFAFEGADDIIIYYCWTRRIRPNLDYEPFLCKGKRQVLKLHEMLRKDLGGLACGIYYFVDRDFDDWAEFEATENAFITDRYSVENYLVCEEVLLEVLKNDFNCRGNPQIRQSIAAVFNDVYAQFLCALCPINARLYLAKKAKIELVDYPLKKINKIIEVRLDKIVLKGRAADTVVVFSRLPTSSELQILEEEFFSLEPRFRHRGKYALDFFVRWLTLLAENYAAASSSMFGEGPRTEKVRQSEFNSTGFAIKSPLPLGLKEFIAKVAPPAAAPA